MPLTFIETNKLPKKASAGQGEVTEVLNQAGEVVMTVRGTIFYLRRPATA